MITLKVLWPKWDVSIVPLPPLLGRCPDRSHSAVFQEQQLLMPGVYQLNAMGYGVKPLSELQLNLLPASLSCMCSGLWKALQRNSLLSSLLLDFKFFISKLIKWARQSLLRLLDNTWPKPQDYLPSLSNASCSGLCQQKNDSTCRLWGL